MWNGNFVNTEESDFADGSILNSLVLDNIFTECQCQSNIFDCHQFLMIAFGS